MIETLKAIFKEKIVIIDVLLVIACVFLVLVPSQVPVGTLRIEDAHDFSVPMEDVISNRLFYPEGITVEQISSTNYSVTMYRNDSNVEKDFIKAVGPFAEIQGNFTYGPNVTRAYITVQPEMFITYYLKEKLGEEPEIIDMPSRGTYKISFSNVYTPEAVNIRMMEKLGEVEDYSTEGRMRWSLGLDLQGGSWVQLEIDSTLVDVDLEDTSYSKMAALYIDSKLDTNTTANRQDISGDKDNRYVVVILDCETDLDDYELEIEIEKLFPWADYVDIETLYSNVKSIEIRGYANRYVSTYFTNTLSSEIVILGEYDNLFSLEIHTHIKETRGVDTYPSLANALSPIDAVTKSTPKSGISDFTWNKLKTTLELRANSYGLKDRRIREWRVDGTVRFVLVDIAGVYNPESILSILKTGRFEAKIGTTIAFTGKDIDAVDPNGVTKYENIWGVTFTITKEAAEHLREVAISEGALDVDTDKTLTMYLDGKIVFDAGFSESLKVELRSKPVTTFRASTGAGEEGRKKAQEVWIALEHDLPVEVTVTGTGHVSPTLGRAFIPQFRNAILAAFCAIGLVIFIKYRNPGATLAMLFTSFSEIMFIFGFAILIKWELDLAAFAGILVAIGTGVDHQILITDETLRGEREKVSVYALATRVKQALAVIIMAALTTIVAMLPLLFLGFGALKGLAFTTIVGVLFGVGLTRPTYSQIIKHILTK